jgi:multidrug efflux pump subunit AcrA (membrane-fusion protein)
MQVLTAQLAQAKAELELVEKQLARTKGYAPFDGIVINGEDWYRKLGAPVERGALLFEIAPLKNYQVILQVDEQDIAEIREQQVGNLVLTSTDHELSFQVTQITPISETKEGRNYFRVEAKLDQALILLKPGMKGIGKIEIEERLMIWIWSRGLVNWLRIWIWSWWP